MLQRASGVGIEMELMRRTRETDPPLGLRRDPEMLERVRARLPAGMIGDEREVFTGNRFAVIVSVDGRFLHASISHRKRYPTWNEIKAVRNWVFPADMEVVMVLPRERDYVNLSENCFHLWQSACGEESR